MSNSLSKSSSHENLTYVGCFARNRTDTNGTVLPPFGPPDRRKSWYNGPVNPALVDQQTTRNRCATDVTPRNAFQYQTIAEGGLYWSCGIKLAYDLGPSNLSMCNMPCGRNATQACGGLDYMDVWLMPRFIDFYGLGINGSVSTLPVSMQSSSVGVASSVDPGGVALSSSVAVSSSISSSTIDVSSSISSSTIAISSPTEIQSSSAQTAAPTPSIQVRSKDFLQTLLKSCALQTWFFV
ncbi:hypothetical protein J1614_011666 [Plenodomus biglobosus]|nr:hypothetical protein J1614_011666 [Plenodomus biglobosus]